MSITCVYEEHIPLKKLLLGVRIGSVIQRRFVTDGGFFSCSKSVS